MKGLKEEREELIEKIETARRKMNQSIEAKEEYDTVYRYSVELDRLIEQYIAAGY